MHDIQSDVIFSPHFRGLAAEGMGGGMTFSIAGARNLPSGESTGFFSWLMSNALSSCSPVRFTHKLA